MVKVVVARHGETIENERGICQGQMNGTLSLRGICQNMELADRLARYPFQAVITSPLRRACETAAMVVVPHPSLSICIDNRLMERDMGVLQGKPFPADYSDETLEEGMESWEDFHDRVNSFIETLQTDYPKKTVLVITHGLVMRMMELIISEQPITQFAAIPLFKNADCLEFEI